MLLIVGKRAAEGGLHTEQRKKIRCDPLGRQPFRFAWTSEVNAQVGCSGGHALKDMVLLFNNERGQTVKRYKLYRCWISEYNAVPDLDANANAVAIENIKLENEGWERDLDTPEPDETGAVPAPPG